MCTDHGALWWLLNVKDATGCLARWSLLLQQYVFDIVYRPGKQNGKAGGLSRRPYEPCELSPIQRDDPRTAKTRELQRRDIELSKIIDFLESDVLPSDDNSARKVLLIKDSFYLGKDGLLYHLDRNHKRNTRDSFSQLVAPQSMRYEILSNVDDHVSGGHFGVHKTFSKD